MKTLFYVCLSLITVSAASSCTAQEEPVQKITSVAYEPCCGLDTMVFWLGNEWVAVPNVFTPNGDSINDLFYPIRSNDSIIISRFRIYDTTYVQPNDPSLIYSTQGILYEYIDQFAWKGKKKIAHGFELHKGKFKYYFRAKYRDYYIECNGEACSIVCDDEAAIFKDKANCFFQNQFDSEGEPNSNIPSGEVEGTCFGN